MKLRWFQSFQMFKTRTNHEVHEGLGTRRFNRKVLKGRKVGDGRDRPLLRTLRDLLRKFGA